MKKQALINLTSYNLSMFYGYGKRRALRIARRYYKEGLRQ